MTGVPEGYERRFTIAPTTPQDPENVSGWEKTLHFAGKPEEWLTKAIGSVLTDDPKYQFGSSTYGDQRWLGDLFQEFMGPIEGTALGLVASVLNPLDPLNKAKIFSGYTKLGLVGKALKGSEHLLEETKIGDKTIKLLSPKQIEANLEKLKSAKETLEARRNLPKDANFIGPEDPNYIRIDDKNYAREVTRLQMEEASLQTKLGEQAKVNDIIKDLQLSGKSIDEIALAPTAWEQARKGQRTALGWQNMLGLGHVPFVPSTIDNMSTTPLVPTAVSEVIFKSASILGQKFQEAGIASLDKVFGWMNKSYRLMKTAQARQAYKEIRSVLDSGEGKIEMLHQLGIRLENQTQLTKIEKHAIVDSFENRFDSQELRALHDIIDKTPDAGIEQKIGKTVPLGAMDKTSKERQIHLVPGDVDDSELKAVKLLWEKETNYDTTAKKLDGDHTARILSLNENRFAVVELNPELANLNELGNTFAGWRVVKDAARPLMIKKLIDGAMPATFDTFSGAHLHNLEIQAAQLAQKKLAIGRINAGQDIYVNGHGGVQIINPSLLVKAKSVKAALDYSDLSVRQLVEDLQISSGAEISLPYLETIKASKAAGTGAENMAIAKSFKDSKDVGEINALELLERAENSAVHRALLRGADVYGMDMAELKQMVSNNRSMMAANNVEAEIIRMTRETNDAKAVSFQPVRYMVDDDGKVWIVDGLDRLTAARMLNIQNVPIYKEPFRGVVTKATGEAYKYSDVWRGRNYSHIGLDDVLKRAPNDPTSITSSETLKAQIADNYRIFVGNKSILPSHRAFYEADVKLSRDVALESIIDLLIHAPKQSKTIKDKKTATLLKLFEEAYGSIDSAALHLSETMKSKGIESVVEDVSKQLSELFDIDRSFLTTSIYDTRELGAIQAKGKLAAVAIDEYIANLARRGIFTTSTVNDPRTIIEFLNTNKGTIARFDLNTKNFSLHSSELDTVQLEKLRDSIFSDYAKGDIDPFVQWKLFGTDGTLGGTYADLVKAPKHPRSAHGPVPWEAVFTKESRELLEKNGIFINPTSDHLSSMGVNFGLAARERSLVYLVSRSGDMIVSANYRSVEDLARAVFGDARDAFKMQEFGVVERGYLTISNPLGSLITKLGWPEVGDIERRLSKLAKRFEAMGLHRDTQIKVISPIPDGAWEAMYGKTQSLSAVASPKFKLEIPPSLKDMPYDVTVDNVQGVVKLKPPELPPNSQKVFEAVDKMNDAAFALDEETKALMKQSAEKSVPAHFIAPYFPRTMTAEAKRALDTTFQAVVKKNPLVATYLKKNPHLMKRLFSDFTTNEINQMLADKTFNFKQLLDEGFEAGDLATIQELANLLPEGIQFFHADPIYAGVERLSASIKLNTEANALEGLYKLGGIWRGSAKDLDNTVKTNERFARKQAQADKLKELVDANDESIAAYKSQDANFYAKEIEKLQATNVKLNSKRLEVLGELNKISKERVEKHGLIADAIDKGAQTVWIKGTDARRLIDEGALVASDIAGDADGFLVQIDYGKYAKTLGEDTEFVLLAPEAENIAARLFAKPSVGDPNTLAGKALNLWDGITQLFRTYTLFPIISYHARNFVSNVYLAALGGADDITSYHTSFQLLNLMKKYRSGDASFDEIYNALDTTFITSNTGASHSLREIYENFVGSGGYSGGLHYNEFSLFNKKYGSNNEFVRLLAENGGVPTSELNSSYVFDNRGIRAARGIASFQENLFRLGAYIDTFKKTGSFEEASLNMKKIFYDYRDMNAFERNVMRRIMPFYSWSRHNIPRMVELMMTKPVEHLRIQEFIKHFEQGTAGGPVDDKDFPKWAKDKYGLIVSKSNGIYYIKTLDGLIPSYDVIKFISNPKDFTVNSLSPFLKIPFEYARNKSFYSGQEIEQFPGQPARSWTLSGLGYTRQAESIFSQVFRPGLHAAKFLDYLFDDRNFRGQKDQSFWAFAADIIIGRVYAVDPEGTRRFMSVNLKRVESEMIGKIRHYSRIGDQRSADAAASWLNWFRLENRGQQYGENTEVDK